MKKFATCLFSAMLAGVCTAGAQGRAPMSVWAHAAYDQHINSMDRRILSGKGHSLETSSHGGYTAGLHMRLQGRRHSRTFFMISFSYRSVPQSVRFSFDPGAFGHAGGVRSYELKGTSEFLVFGTTFGFNIANNKRGGAWDFLVGLQSHMLLGLPAERVMYTGPAANGVDQNLLALRETRWHNARRPGLPMPVLSLGVRHYLPDRVFGGRGAFIGLQAASAFYSNNNNDALPVSRVEYFDIERRTAGESSYTDRLTSVSLEVGFSLFRTSKKQVAIKS